jgi:SHS2 domain-containing protein
MQEYKILEHTADVRLLVKGKTLHDLFTAALAGMNEIMGNKKNGRITDDLDRVRELSIVSLDTTGLLIDFLSEVLTISHQENTIFPLAEFLRLDDNSLEGWIFGRKVREFKEDIKAVTYHEAEVRRNEQGELETIIIFDI